MKVTNKEECNNVNVPSTTVKLYVGQNLWLVSSHNYKRVDLEPIEVTISKVGKRYFELVGYTRSKFDIQTLKQVTDTNYIDECYLTLQEIFDKRESDKLIEKIRKVLGGYNKPNLTLEQLRKIWYILNDDI